jgi:NADPH:quinone reductase-like Zn-dependent oxidoreductase
MAISIPKTQHAAVVDKPGKDAKAYVKEIPVEEPAEGEVLIKMKATGGTNSFPDIYLCESAIPISIYREMIGTPRW